ncbi:MAG: hypothetical protein LBE33_01545 [Zoogloeaceae bacterium]|jgi:type III secretory pathway component EscV|nr:hypothetical protein [Zoogloeaceae bacterium]
MINAIINGLATGLAMLIIMAIIVVLVTIYPEILFMAGALIVGVILLKIRDHQRKASEGEDNQVRARGESTADVTATHNGAAGSAKKLAKVRQRDGVRQRSLDAMAHAADARSRDMAARGERAAEPLKPDRLG